MTTSIANNPPSSARPAEPERSRSEKLRMPPHLASDWQTGRSYSGQLIAALPSLESLSKEESKQAHQILQQLPNSLHALSYQDFRLLMGLTLETIEEQARYQDKVEKLGHAHEILKQLPESHRELAKQGLEQALQQLAERRPASLTEKLQEQLSRLEAGAVIPVGVASISPSGLPVVKSLLKLAILDSSLQSPLPPGLAGVLAPPADYGFTSEVLRLLRLSFPGGINVRHPEQTSAGAGVFENFSHLRISVGSAATAVTFTPCKEGYRYEVPQGPAGSVERGILAPGQTLLCGRRGGIPISIAGVRARIGQEDLKTDLELSGDHISRAAIEIKALENGGIVIVDRGSRNTVGFELTPHGRHGSLITGQYTSVIFEGRLGQSQESIG